MQQQTEQRTHGLDGSASLQRPAWSKVPLRGSEDWMRSGDIPRSALVCLTCQTRTRGAPLGKDSKGPPESGTFQQSRMQPRRRRKRKRTPDLMRMLSFFICLFVFAFFTKTAPWEMLMSAALENELYKDKHCFFLQSNLPVWIKTLTYVFVLTQ